MPSKFVLRKARSGKFSFTLEGPTGRVLAKSGDYPTKRAALAGVQSVQRNAAGAGVDDQTAPPAKATAPRKKATAKRAPAKQVAKQTAAAKKTESKRSAKKTAASKPVRKTAAKRRSPNRPRSR